MESSLHVTCFVVWVEHHFLVVKWGYGMVVSCCINIPYSFVQMENQLELFRLMETVEPFELGTVMSKTMRS